MKTIEQLFWTFIIMFIIILAFGALLKKQGSECKYYDLTWAAGWTAIVVITTLLTNYLANV